MWVALQSFFYSKRPKCKIYGVKCIANLNLTALLIIYDVLVRKLWRDYTSLCRSHICLGLGAGARLLNFSSVQGILPLMCEMGHVSTMCMQHSTFVVIFLVRILLNILAFWYLVHVSCFHRGATVSPHHCTSLGLGLPHVSVLIPPVWVAIMVRLPHWNRPAPIID